MITYKLADTSDLPLMISSRLEMLRCVNALPADYKFNADLIRDTEEYFKNGVHSTVLAISGVAIGCATLCYTDVMPTLSHPTGKRAHLINVYTKPEYRRQGVAAQMVKMLIDEAKRRGVTEISLDATESGRPLYEKLGFIASDECMTLTLK